ncbi:MAG: glycosyltransferase [Planctomycetes bacterium]|nr:glycosyltransferase [Planctomycetota bacterium]NOG53619.1 glycosyltransferase [Planctomycetota bacterium]
MHVVHVCASLDPATGGPANVLARMAAEQARRGHTVHVVTADPADLTDTQIDMLKAAGVTCSFTGTPADNAGSSPIPAGKTLSELLNDPQTDLAHCHGIWQPLMHQAMGLARTLGKPYIVRPAGMLDPWSLRQKRLKKAVFLALRGKRDFNNAAALHFTTDTEKRLVEPLRLKPRPFVIPNGIDWDEFENLPAPGSFRAQWHIDDAPLIVFLSRLHYKKGLDLLLPAFAEACGSTDARLALIGPGEEAYVATLKTSTQKLGIAERVIFPGMIKGADRIAALADADLFALPSYQENFGVAVVEALAAGTPVLISDQVNLHHEISQARVGSVCPCKVEPLTRLLKEAMSDREKLAEMGRNGRDWVKRTFQWAIIVDSIDEMYRSITEATP